MTLPHADLYRIPYPRSVPTEREWPFVWGETVRVRASAPDSVRPGEFADIVGFRKVPGPKGERVLCTIEFGDGRDAELDATLLERVTLTNAE